jgi:HPt (histidine-containing phosphotransfer) domain-containing protein
VEERNSQFETGVVPRKPVDGLHCTLPLERPAYRPILDDFLEELPKRLEAMRSALIAQDFDGLAQLAHALKGAGGSIGYSAFTDPCRELERASRENEDRDFELLVNQVAAVADAIVVPSADAALTSVSEKSNDGPSSEMSSCQT